MEKLFIILHILLSLTLLPLLMKSRYSRDLTAIAILISLAAAPAAMVIGPFACFIGWAVVQSACWLFRLNKK